MSVTIIKVKKIGNLKGLFPKDILAQVGVIDTVKLVVKNKLIVISSGNEKRKKRWSDFKKVKRKRVDFAADCFDVKEWTW